MTRRAGPAAPLIKRIISGFGDNRLRVGFFETQQYDDGTPVAYVAAIHEFGAPEQGIPPRPFMRPAAEEHKSEWDRAFADGAAAAARGAITPEQVLEQIGLVAAGNVSEAIAAVQEPPLKPETVQQKQRAYERPGTLYQDPDSPGDAGSLTKPLVRTGQLIQSPTYVVDRKGGE